METMIDLIDVTKSYGKGLPAVNHANLHVDRICFCSRKQWVRKIYTDQTSYERT